MPTPGEEVYHNDVIFRALVKHLYKTTLRSVMMMEQKGETFDRCVKELYRDMVYDVIHNMNRDSERAIKYLDAVRTIDANTPRQGTDEQAYVAKLDRDGSLVATLAEVEALRLKCPNLRLITRHDPPAQHPSVTITLKKGESTGTVKLHHRFGKPTMVDPASQLPPEIHDEPWPGWVFEQTSTLWVMPCAERTSYHRTDLEQKLSNIADLSRSYAEVDTANLPMTLDLLTRVVRSRRPDDLPISRISSTVKNFTLDEFSDFIRAAGAELTELELFPWGSCSRLSLLDIPRLCLLVRQSCPKLLTLRLPVSNRRWDSSAPSPWYSMRRIRSDTEGDAPSPTLSFSDGTLQHLGLFLCRWYDVQLDTPRKRKLMSFNFARSLACLLAPGGHLVLMDGDHRPHGKAPWYTLELHHNTWVQVVMSAVAFFHRLGPKLEPHFREVTLRHLGIRRLTDLRDAKYRIDGTPYTLQESRLIEQGLPQAMKRPRHLHTQCRHGAAGDAECEAVLGRKARLADTAAHRERLAVDIILRHSVPPSPAYALYLYMLQVQARIDDYHNYLDYISGPYDGPYEEDE